MLNFTNSSHHFREPEWMSIALHLTSSVTFMVGFPINIIIINLVARRDSLRNSTNFFVSSLAVADLLVLLWMMIWTIGTHAFAASTLSRYIYSSLDIFLGVASMLNVACVSADRAIAVSYPLTYENLLTKKRSFTLISFCWVYAFALLGGALLRYQFRNRFYNKVILYLGFSSYFVPVFIIITSYVIIFLIIIHKLKGFRELEKVMSNARLVFNNQDPSERRRRRRRKLLRELKVTGNVLLIVVPFTVGWTFFIGTHLYETVNKVKLTNDGYNFSLIIIPWILSGLNPILYLLLNRSLRRAFISSFRKVFKSDKNPFEESRFSILVSFSRRASSVFRRASASIDEENGFLNVPKMTTRRRESHSKSSCDATAREVETEFPLREEREEIVQYATVV